MKTKVNIYVDGSFNPVTNQYGAGVVVIRDGEVVQEIVLPCPDTAYSKYRNVAGEVMGAMAGLMWVGDNFPDAEISVYHDYAGIGLWPTGKWSANNTMSISYVNFVKQCPFKVNFIKVKGHSGDQWNERADRLARQAVGLN